MKTIESEIVLSAPPNDAWAVLIDFESYPDWNPFLPRVDAELGEGEPLQGDESPASRQQAWLCGSYSLGGSGQGAVMGWTSNDDAELSHGDSTQLHT